MRAPQLSESLPVSRQYTPTGGADARTVRSRARPPANESVPGHNESVPGHAAVAGPNGLRRAARPVPEQMETPTQPARAAPGGTRSAAAAAGAAEPHWDGRSRTARTARVRKGGFGER